jgi:transposase InsO family protein
MALAERAQRLLGEALAELSPIVGGMVEWKRLGKLYEALHAQWYRLERLRANPRLKLDGCAAQALKGPEESGGPLP